MKGNKITEAQKGFIRGYSCACAAYIDMHGHDIPVTELYGCNFHTVKELKEAGVDEWDIKRLKPVIKEIEERRKK